MNKKTNFKKNSPLVIINLILILSLYLIHYTSSAKAQMLQRSNVTGITGSANGANGELLYLINTTNGEMTSLSFDINAKNLKVIGYRNLIQDGQFQQGNNR